MRNRSSHSGRALHPMLWMLVAVVLITASILGYLVLAPGPTAFAQGKRVALAQYHGQDPTGVPPELKSASIIERGEYLARAADCAVCHTAKDGVPFAGGRAFVLPFGTLYSTNITPDPETGIGNYTDVNFLNAVHEGIARGETKLYPAMPYASYTYMSDDDALAIKAYLFSLKPLHSPAPHNTLIFPFNQRRLMGFWSILFNPNVRFEPNENRSDEWNRGAYLVEGLGHCGECHTPRNLAFALNNRKKFAGAIQAGWRAYNITADHESGVGSWSDADLAHYLSTGHADGRGTTSGPMGEVVDESLSHLLPSDVNSLVVYLRTVPSISSSDLPEPRTTPASSVSPDGAIASANPHGQAVYEDTCAGCHGWSGLSSVLPSATLIGARGINDAAATNVAQVIIRGGQRHTGGGFTDMPPFGGTYSDAEIASVANYITARFGRKGSNLTAAQVAKLRVAD
jgi:mono/diheme cytochrome c family protein